MSYSIRGQCRYFVFPIGPKNTNLVEEFGSGELKTKLLLLDAVLKILARSIVLHPGSADVPGEVAVEHTSGPASSLSDGMG